MTKLDFGWKRLLFLYKKPAFIYHYCIFDSHHLLELEQMMEGGHQRSTSSRWECFYLSTNAAASIQLRGKKEQVQQYYLFASGCSVWETWRDFIQTSPAAWWDKTWVPCKKGKPLTSVNAAQCYERLVLYHSVRAITYNRLIIGL